MNNTKHIDTDTDLQQLKSKYADFKERIDKQTILTPTLIQTAIKSQVKTVISVIRKCTIACGIAILLWLCVGGFFKLSLTFIIFTCLFMAADSFADNWTFWPLRKLFAPTTTLLQAAKMVTKSRRRLYVCFVTGVITLMPWLAWLAWEFINSPVCGIDSDINSEIHFTWVLVISAAIGLIIGVIIAWKIVLKLRSNLSEIDRNIQECLSDSEEIEYN